MKAVVCAVFAMMVVGALATLCPFCTKEQCMKTNCRVGPNPFACLAGAGGGGCGPNASAWWDPEKCTECCRVDSCPIGCTNCDEATCHSYVCPTSSLFVCTTGNSTGGCGGPKTWTDTPSCTSCCDLGACGQPNPEPESCPYPLTPTVRWNPSCTQYDPTCWVPHRPTTDDVALFPPSTNLTLSAVGAQQYPSVTAGSIIIESGARVTMASRAIVSMKCFVVRGELRLVSASRFSAVAPFGDSFPADGSAPQGVSCHEQWGGFTPRICGPGRMYIAGKVFAAELYSSLWAPITVLRSGNLTLGSDSFLWSNVSNYGTIQAANGIYMQGRIDNYGILKFSHVNWAFLEGRYNAKGEVTINNFEYMSFEHTTNKIRMVIHIVNRKKLQLLAGYGADQVHPLDIANFGELTAIGRYGTRYVLEGQVINGGVLIANDSNVYLNKYVNQGGVIRTINGGHVYGGNGAGLQEPCENFPDPDRSKIPANATQCDPNAPNKCPSGQCCGKSGMCEKTVCFCGMCCQGNMHCAGYHGCYCNGYGAPYIRYCGHRLALKYLSEEALKGVPTRNIPPKWIAQRYSFRATTTIEGDGTGTVLISEPFELAGTIRVAAGGRMYIGVEHGRTPYVGGGNMEVLRGGQLSIGVDAHLDEYGTIRVAEGGKLVIPRHSTVVWSNHSISIARGATLRVDGVMTLRRGSSVEMCGEVGGEGILQRHAASWQEKSQACQ